MKKAILTIGLAVLTLGSCTTTNKTATTIDVANTVSQWSKVDLDISPTRISYEYEPTAKVRRGGKNNVIQTAVREALKANNNAEVLVAPEYDLRYRIGLFSGKKLKQVTVYGYPAKYKNFRQASN